MPIQNNIPVIDERLYDVDVRQRSQSAISDHYKRDNPQSLPLSLIELLMLHEGFAWVENIEVTSNHANQDGTLFEITNRLVKDYGSFTGGRPSNSLAVTYEHGKCPIGHVSNFRLVQPSSSSSLLSSLLARDPRVFGVYVRFAWPGEEPKDFEKLLCEKFLEGFSGILDDMVLEAAGQDIYLPPAYIAQVIDRLKSSRSFETAANLAEKVGWKEYSRSLWQMEAKEQEAQTHYGLAGEAMLKAGSEPEAKRLFMLAMEIYVSILDFKTAAVYAAKAGLSDKAAEYKKIEEAFDGKK